MAPAFRPRLFAGLAIAAQAAHQPDAIRPRFERLDRASIHKKEVKVKDVSDHDETDFGVERLPLAGGVPDGARVTIRGNFTGVDQEGAPFGRVDFIKPDQTLALGWHVDDHGDSLGILRVVNGRDEYGGYYHPLDSSRVGKLIEFNFVKLHDSFAVTVDGQRTPWYDVDLSFLSEREITHVNMGSGIGDTTVFVQRPLCSTSCHRGECEDEVGNSTCVVEGEVRPAAECFSKSLAGGCTASVRTDEEGTQGIACCEGQPRSVRWKKNATLVNQWAFVHENASDRACTAQWYEDEYFQKDCKQFKGAVVQILRVDPRQNHVAVWSPSVYGCSKALCDCSGKVCPPDYETDESVGKIAFVPIDIVYQTTPTVERFLIPHSTMGSSKWQFEPFSGFIAGSPKPQLVGKYIHLMHETAEEGYDPEGPWSSWIKDRWDFWASAGSHVSVSLIVADTPFEKPPCRDLPKGSGSYASEVWTYKDQTCDAFAQSGKCDALGNGSGRHTKSCTNEKCYVAQKACCACGGGEYGGDYKNPPVKFSIAEISLS